jgi:CRISPR/Cas system-associated endonuclease Cas3-HD
MACVIEKRTGIYEEIEVLYKLHKTTAKLHKMQQLAKDTAKLTILQAEVVSDMDIALKKKDGKTWMKLNGLLRMVRASLAANFAKFREMKDI